VGRGVGVGAGVRVAGGRVTVGLAEAVEVGPEGKSPSGKIPPHPQEVTNRTTTMNPTISRLRVSLIIIILLSSFM
jgi:hypothetical protein